MKLLKLVFLTLLLTFVSAFSQPAPDSKPDAELTFDQAKIRIENFQARVAELEAKLQTNKDNAAAIQKEIDKAIQNLKDCEKALSDLIGASDADIESFRQRLGVLIGKVRDLRRLSDDEIADRRSEAEAFLVEYQELQRSKISILPEFFDKMVQLGKDIKYLLSREKKIRSYTVGTWAENRDCLWNIAGKMEIFADPFMWPKIWQANKDQIRNPDVIYPGQVLQLPEKGPKDADALKMERKYYRMKKEAAEAQTGSTTPSN